MMGTVILILAVIGALFAIASGVWVAVALVRAISVRKTISDKSNQTREESSD
jgi:hypothetical protein